MDHSTHTPLADSDLTEAILMGAAVYGASAENPWTQTSSATLAAIATTQVSGTVPDT